MSLRLVRSHHRARGLRATLAAVLCTWCIGPSVAFAYPIHQVGAGENLSSIAAANGMPVARLAAANGLAWNSYVVAGQTLQIPPVNGLYTSTTGQTMGYATSRPPVARTGAAAATRAATTSSSGVTSAYVRPGDTLSAIAARMGVTIHSLAAANGIADHNLVVAGTTLRAPSGLTASPAPASTSTGPEGAAAAAGTGAGNTSERLSSSQIAAIAAQHGVPGNLAAAIAWQESGNNNAMVSSTGARGVMQIMPGTWDWINTYLARPPLQRNSAADNVRAGSLLLGQLLKDTGGDEATAVAGYYQGLSSVRSRGLYDDTKQYVKNVLSLKSRVG